MALLSADDRKRLVIPHEPDQWIEVRPVTARDSAAVEALAAGKSQLGLGLGILEHCIVAWSYDAEVNAENIGRLDMTTFSWLMETVDVTGGGRDTGEKKGLAGNSSQPSPRRMQQSRRNSGT